ncbi:MAG: CBS domain-containing protein [Candidatus Aquicultor sp.]
MALHDFNAKTVQDVMKTEVARAYPMTSARDVSYELMKGRFSGMPIVDDSEYVIGVVTEIDLIEKSTEAAKELESLTAEQVMTKDPVTVRDNAPPERRGKNLGRTPHNSRSGC